MVVLLIELTDYASVMYDVDFFIIQSSYTWLFIFLFISIVYILKYRIKILFCFELFFFAFLCLSIFYKEIVLNSMSALSGIKNYYFIFSDTATHRTMLVNMLSFSFFCLGASVFNKQKDYSSSESILKIEPQNKIGMSSAIINTIVWLYIIYLIVFGVVQKWFHYSNEISDYTNLEVSYITILLLTSTVIELVRLNQLGVHGKIRFIQKVNKFYISSVLFIGMVLLLSGNRNEALLVIFPLVAGYSILIQRISNKSFIFLLLIGIPLMMIIGFTRNDSNSALIGDNLYENTRDFAPSYACTNYLIEKTDAQGAIGFGNSIVAIASSIPFLGSSVKAAFDIESAERSTVFTTKGLNYSHVNTGLGTSLIGDLYYTGNIYFTLIYMFLFGCFISYLHQRFYVKKDFNIWLFVIFLFLFSNVVYCVRAEWTMPFRYVGFSLLLLAFTKLFDLGLVKS